MKLTKEIRIALVAIVGILVMYFGINFLKGINLFSTNNTYYMTFDDIQGMGASTPIYADGYKVGTRDDAARFDTLTRIVGKQETHLEIAHDILRNLCGTTRRDSQILIDIHLDLDGTLS